MVVRTGWPLLAEDVPEHHRRRLAGDRVEADQAGALGQLFRRHGRGAEPGQVALDVGEEDRHPLAREALGQNLQGHRLAGAGGAGDQPVAVGEPEIERNRPVAALADEDRAVAAHRGVASDPGYGAPAHGPLADSDMTSMELHPKSFKLIDDNEIEHLICAHPGAGCFDAGLRAGGAPIHRRLDDEAKVVEARPPAETLADAAVGGDQRRRIAGAARPDPPFQAALGDRAHRFQNLAHGEAMAVAAIEHDALAARDEVVERLDVSVGEVADVNVVAHAGAIGGRDNRRRRPPCRRADRGPPGRRP